jgi:hypothetical protein
MSTIPNPFDPSVFDKLDDMCRNKHKGHEDSVAAQSCFVGRRIGPNHAENQGQRRYNQPLCPPPP